MPLLLLRAYSLKRTSALEYCHAQTRMSKTANPPLTPKAHQKMVIWSIGSGEGRLIIAAI